MSRSGKMRHLLAIERPTSAPNELNELERNQASDWEAIAEVWAEVIPLRSAEVVRAKQAGLDQTHTVRFRYFDGLTSDCRLRWDQNDGTTRILNILGIINVGELGAMHELQTTESKRA